MIEAVEYATSSQKAARIAHMERRRRMDEAALKLRPLPKPTAPPIAPAIPRAVMLAGQVSMSGEVQGHFVPAVFSGAKVSADAGDTIAYISSGLTIRQIQLAVSKALDVPMSDILSARRTAPVVFARQIAMMFAKLLTLRSLPEIGRRFGDRDHTTVLHAVRKFKPVSERIRPMIEAKQMSLPDMIQAAVVIHREIVENYKAAPEC